MLVGETHDSLDNPPEVPMGHVLILLRQNGIRDWMKSILEHFM